MYRNAFEKRKAKKMVDPLQAITSATEKELVLLEQARLRANPNSTPFAPTLPYKPPLTFGGVDLDDLLRHA